MSRKPVPWSDADKLEDVFMAAGDGGEESIATLARSLESGTPGQMAQWDASLRESWEVGAELAMEGMDRQALRRCDVQLLEALLSVGLDTPLFRDMLAVAARSEFSDYLDPAGLLQALGVLDRSVPMVLVANRWELFTHLTPGAVCLHASQGLGKVVDIDAFGNQVTVKFARRQRFSLRLAFASLVLVRKGSLVDQLARGKKTLRESVAAGDDFDARAAASLVVPAAVQTPLDELVRSCLVPDVVTPERWESRFGEEPPPEKITAPVAKESTREWSEARNLTEMLQLIKARNSRVGPPPKDPENAVRLFDGVGQRVDQAPTYSETISRLWQAAPSEQWLTEMLQAIVHEAICWQDQALFAQLSDGLPGRQVSSWFASSASAAGVEWLCRAAMDLPLRLWGPLERWLLEEEGNADRLVENVLVRIKAGTSSADQLLWLWRTERPERSVLADPPLLFRTLGRVVKGNYIKANKDLRKAMFEDQEFLAFLLRQGDPIGVTSMVQCIRHLPLLNKGEQQSLLVRIVRIFPHAKPLVEVRQKKVERRAIGKITSIRSFELRRRELEEIINKKIPANSRAIAHARSYGDLRENAEFKAAKEEQAYLGARRSELEQDLHEVRSTDFGDVVVRDRVVPGSTVVLSVEGGADQTFHVLGLWDSIPEMKTLSYETPLGRALVGKQLDDDVEMPTGEEAVIKQVLELSEDMRAWLRGEDLPEA